MPLLLRRRTAGKIYVQVGRFPKGQMFLYFRADRIQAVSNAIAREIVRQAPKLSRKVVTIGYAIADAYGQAHSPLRREKIILYVGRIAREKGVHILVKAFLLLVMKRSATQPFNWKLRIVGPHEVVQGGDGIELLAELQELARPLGSKCEFAGPVFDEQALIREYQRASVFVYPSLAEQGEALPVAPLEAMAAGCAAVVSNLRCFDDYIEDGISGLKFEHRVLDPERELASQLERLITESQLIEHIATKGTQSAASFRTSAIAAKMLDDFAQLAGTSSATSATQARARTQSRNAVTSSVSRHHAELRMSRL